jgi:hypothetical protein
VIVPIRAPFASQYTQHGREDTMRTKLTLKLEDLSVDSFDTTTPQKAKGTVFGEQCTCWTNCTCPGCPTCYASCNGTCGGTCGENTCAASCNGTCAGCGTEYEDTCQWTCTQTAQYTHCGDIICY